MSALDDAIAEFVGASDISAESEAYAEVVDSLSPFALNLAFFVFESRAHSSCARTLEDGQTQAFPVLTLFLKYQADFRATGISPRFGNWDDEWEHTKAVRSAVNAVLERHRYGSDYVSDRTFIFVHSREWIAFLKIAHASKGVVRELVWAVEPEIDVSDIFYSHGQRKYHVVLEHWEDYDRLKRTLADRLANTLPVALAAADEQRYCQCYDVSVEIVHAGMDLQGPARED